jgi:hypothetical protein
MTEPFRQFIGTNHIDRPMSFRYAGVQEKKFHARLQLGKLYRCTVESTEFY